MFRSKCRYYNLGEKSTKYFFNLEKARSGARSINSLIDDNGRETTKQYAILDQLKDFYQKLYTKDTPQVRLDYVNETNNKITEAMKHFLDEDIMQEEIAQALKGMKRGVTPGKDGLTVEFYIVNYIHLKDLLYEAFTFELKNGRLHDSALQGIITLIPKKQKDCRKIKNLHPISLLNTEYKLIEKVMANRLKIVLDGVLDDAQQGFRPGKHCAINIRRVLDLVEIAEKWNLEGVILSLDFEKCFDRVEIPSLIQVLKYFGVGEKFCAYTKALYNEATAQVINNGNISVQFNLE